MAIDNLSRPVFGIRPRTTSPEWATALERLGSSSELDLKTKALCYLSALAAAKMPNEVSFHVDKARALGATRDEVIGAVFVGLSATVDPIVDEAVAVPAASES
jgi:alkylhydroperoxidase/carboxymuconolactone decarboxylase family protein YurZ